MNTDTTGTTAAVSAEMFRHEFNAAGVCESPEVVCLDMPKHFSAEIRLALSTDGWRVGFEYDGPPVGVGMRGVLPALADVAFSDRSVALAVGARQLAEALSGKARARRAVEAVQAWAKKQGFDLSELRGAVEADGEAPADEPPEPPTLLLLTLPEIAIDGRNPRKDFDPDALVDLAESIAANGILQPLIVRRRRLLELAEDLVDGGLDPHYVVVAGERRYRAAVLVENRGIRMAVPCVVYERLSERQALIIALTENLQRAQMNPIEEAEGFARLAELGLTQQEIAATVRKSRPVVANALRLLDLPESVRGILRSGRLTTAHGVALARFKAWPKIAGRIAELAVEKKMPAGDLEEGFPFAYDLQREELAYEIHLWDFRDEFELSAEPGEQGIPKVLSEQSWIFVDSSDEHASDPDVWAMDVPAYTYWIAARRTEQEAAEAATAAKSKKVGGNGPVLDLSRINAKEYRKVDELPAAVRKAISPELIERGDYYGQKNVPVVRGETLALANKLERAATIEANREKRAELDAAWQAAVAKISQIEALEGGTVAQLLEWACGDYQIGGQAEVVTDAAEALEIELPKGVKCIGHGVADKLSRFTPVQLLRLTLAIRARAAWRVAHRAASPLPDDLKLFGATPDEKPAKKKAAKAPKKAA